MVGKIGVEVVIVVIIMGVVVVVVVVVGARRYPAGKKSKTRKYKDMKQWYHKLSPLCACQR